MNSLDNLDSNHKPEILRPGGVIGFPKVAAELLPTVTRWKEKLNGDDWGFSCMRDPDFVTNFVTKVPEADEQDKFVTNTSKYLSHDRNDYDPKYVLLFRRSLPSETPKPEAHWTGDYISARNGLRKEIPGEHRLHTVILCSTLDTLINIGLDEQTIGGTDEEIKIKSTAFNQKDCLLSFRPSDQQEQLDTYLKTESATTLPQLLEQLKELKSK